MQQNIEWKYLLTFIILGVLRLCHCSADAVTDASVDELDLQKPTQAGRKNKDKFDTPFCSPCDLKQCPRDVTPESCQGTVIKDECNCCPICEANTLSIPPAPPTTLAATVTNDTGKIYLDLSLLTFY
jgi:hypothetical protein